MSKERWEIELISVGRRDVWCIYESRCDTLAEVEEWAKTHCKKYIAGKAVYLEHHRDLIYGVYTMDGFEGVIKITSIPEKTKCQAHQKP